MSNTTHRMHTRVLVVVHSHSDDKNPIHLSPDVIAMRSSKTTKGAGQLSLEVVPRSNYFNKVYPNDVINVYVDPGDGVRGFVRLFMGYIDKIERTETTDEKGGVSSMFKLACTDFQKVFDRTTIHQNPHLQNRVDLVDEELLISGATGLMTLGIRAHGTPADMIENLASMLLGFGSQWVLPKSYVEAGNKVVKDNRQRRKQRSKARLPSNYVLAFSNHIGDLDATLLDFDKAEEVEAAINRSNVPRGGKESDFESFSNTFKSGRKGGVLDPEIFAILRDGQMQLRSYRTTLSDITSNTHTMLDLLDFSFIESAAIDGYIHNDAVWNKGGILASTMRSFSNEIVNELIFDLRPVATDGKTGSLDDSQFLDRCFGEQYWKGKDELGYNHGYDDNGEGVLDSRDAFAGAVPAVAYAPAIIFREYPYSCVEGVDLGPLRATDDEPLGFVPFGPVFSKRSVGENGRYRAIYNYKDIPEVADSKITISPIACQFTEDTAPLKHIDVVTIRDTDVVNSTIGRSDNDVRNLTTMYAEDGLAETYKYILNMFMPITNAVSIARNGLRVREDSSRFANYGRAVTCSSAVSGGKQSTLRNMVRWLLLLDHWDQHNVEYLSGEITMRGMPELRVGYRLDWEDRKESYYVESVSHGWSFGKEMVTTVQVTRGQRNDPFLSYIPPKSSTLTTSSSDRIEGGDRNSTGRLADFFEVNNTPATYRSTQARNLEDLTTPDEEKDGNSLDMKPRGVLTHFTSGSVVYADGTRQHAVVLPPIPLTEEQKRAKAATPIAKEPATVKKPRYATRDFDDVFRDVSYGEHPFLGATEAQQVAFMRALAKRESSLNPNESNDPAWGLMQVGIDNKASVPGPALLKADGTEASGNSGGVLKSYNNKGKGGPYTVEEMLDPAKNVRVASELIQRIVRVMRAQGMSPNWTSKEFIGILACGWNSGYSKKAGTGYMIEWLISEKHEVTLANVHFKAAESPNGYRLLSVPTRYTWWQGVVRQYFAELERDKARG